MVADLVFLHCDYQLRKKITNQLGQWVNWVCKKVSGCLRKKKCQNMSRSAPLRSNTSSWTCCFLVCTWRYFVKTVFFYPSFPFQNSKVDSAMNAWLGGRSKTTFTRQGRQVVLKSPLFVNVHTIGNVNAWKQVAKKAKILST